MVTYPAPYIGVSISHIQKRIPKDYQALKSHILMNGGVFLRTYIYRSTCFLGLALIWFIQPVSWLPCPNLNPMMSSGSAAFLLLVVVAVVCLGCVSGASCTMKQKNDVLKICEKDIKLGGPNRYPSKFDNCCQLVRLLEGPNLQIMECIVNLLTNGDKKYYDKDRILMLRKNCFIPPSVAPDLVKFNIIGYLVCTT
jgi:hypothetical protein